MIKKLVISVMLLGWGGLSIASEASKNSKSQTQVVDPKAAAATNALRACFATNDSRHIASLVCEYLLKPLGFEFRIVPNAGTKITYLQHPFVSLTNQDFLWICYGGRDAEGNLITGIVSYDQQGTKRRHIQGMGISFMMTCNTPIPYNDVLIQNPTLQTPFRNECKSIDSQDLTDISCHLEIQQDGKAIEGLCADTSEIILCEALAPRVLSEYVAKLRAPTVQKETKLEIKDAADDQ